MSVDKEGLSKSLRILVADDDRLGRVLVRDVLQWRGHSIFEAQDGREAVALARSETVDLVVLNTGMPEMAGEAVLTTLRADARTAAIPVIAYTAKAMVGDAEALMRLGFDGYLQKPASLKDILEIPKFACVNMAD